MVHPAPPHPTQQDEPSLCSLLLPFPGPITAHTSHTGSAIVGLSRCSHAASSPGSRSLIPSSSILLLLVATTQWQSSPTHLPRCCFFSSLRLRVLPSTLLPWLTFTAPAPRAHLLFLSCFSLLTQVHPVPAHQLPTPNSKHHPQNLKASSFRLPAAYPPIPRSFLGRSRRYFTHTYFSKPPFLRLLLQSLRRTHDAEGQGWLSCSRYLSSPHLITFASRSIPARAASLLCPSSMPTAGR